ncbi:hypothetical protein [Methanosarcina siciliae]|uniref:hypothetical protein n=1 Tax=Methanosarcina siciliae TaxID=38027 RepID=UPI000A81923D|nr:hypothetical protein [Methanosarcina siciliae]
MIGPGIPEILPLEKFIIYVNKNTIDSTLALGEKAGLAADRKKLLKNSEGN